MDRFSGTADSPGAPVTAKLVKERYERSVKAMRLERQQYITNKSFLQGNQWCQWNERQDTLRDVERLDSRTRVTLNRLRPASRHLMSKLLSRDLVFEVPPSDTDSATIRGSKTAEAVLSDLHREHKWEELRETLAWSTWLGGTAGLAIDWDTAGGTPISTLPLTGATVGTGEIIESPMNILEMAWEPGTKDAERGFWWIRAQAIPPDEAQMRYGLKKRPAADAAAAAGYLGRATTQREGDAPINLTLVLTMYERPTKLRPGGCIATVIGNEIVDGGPKNWNFPWKDRLNLVLFRESKADGRATGDTVFSDAILTQAAYNASWSNLLEHAKLAGNARLAVPEGSEEYEEFADLPGEIITFSSTLGKPEWITPPNLPAWLIEQPDRLAAQMDDQLGYHDVSRGVAPSGMESGVGLSILVEQDSTPIGALTKEFAQGFERYATLCLRLYQAKVTEPRTARLHNPGTISEIVRWTGSALAGQTVVDIPMDAILPRSRAAMLSFAERMLSLQVIPPNRPDIFAKIADLPGQADLIAAVDEDSAKTSRMLQLIASLPKGDPNLPIPARFDNFAKVITLMNSFRKTARYESMEDWRRQWVDKYMDGCETMAAEQMGNQVAKMMAHPAMAASPTANAHAPLPDGMVLPGAAGGPAPTPAPPGAPAGPPAGPQGPAPQDPASNPLPGTMSAPVA